jgi:hypothetical protein
MRHPFLDFEIPPRFVALLDWLLADYRPGGYQRTYEAALLRLPHGLYDVDSYLLDARAGVPIVDDWAAQGELGKPNHPRELIPFAQRAGTGRVYGWVLLAPELESDDLPCVSCDSEHDDGAAWLGDDTQQALENMLVGSLRDSQEYRPEDPSPTEHPSWAALCAALALRPDYARTDITVDAISTRSFAPEVPPGWQYVPTDDGIGVLAPTSTFASEPFVLASLDGEESTLALAQAHLRAGHPASALVVVKDGYYDESPRRLVELQAEAFLALGRPVLAARAARWLELTAR